MTGFLRLSNIEMEKLCKFLGKIIISSEVRFKVKEREKGEM